MIGASTSGRGVVQHRRDGPAAPPPPAPAAAPPALAPRPLPLGLGRVALRALARGLRAVRRAAVGRAVVVPVVPVVPVDRVRRVAARLARRRAVVVVLRRAPAL